MYSPGVLWTAAHHRIPMLYVMHNNRAYHQEVMHCSAWRTGASAASTAPISGPRSTIRIIDYATMAKGFGVAARADHRSQGARAGAQEGGRRRQAGQPALVDVVTQAR